MNSENRRDVYLPEGKWVNFFTGERLEGGRWLKNLDIPLDEMPVYVRARMPTIPVYPDEVECTDDMDLSKSIGLHIDPHFKGILWKKLTDSMETWKTNLDETKTTLYRLVEP